MGKLTDRCTAWILRSIGTMMLFAGISVVVGAVPVFGMLTAYPLARTIAGIFFQISGVFIVAGAAAMYLSRPRGLLLPNERETASDAGRPEVGGWLIALAVALVALPVWLVLRLQPFLSEWGRVGDFLATPGMWEGANANGSGLVLLPLAGALTPPLFELAAMAAFVVASAALLLLLVSRSHRFPRVFIVCVVLLSALVIASVRGSDAAMLAAGGVRQFLEGSNPRPGEDAELTEGLRRYTSVVSSTASVLVWTLCGYLVWVPAMITSRRAATTFATGAGGRVATDTTAKATDLEAITSPPRFPG